MRALRFIVFAFVFVGCTTHLRLVTTDDDASTGPDGGAADDGAMATLTISDPITLTTGGTHHGAHFGSDVVLSEGTLVVDQPSFNQLHVYERRDDDRFYHSQILDVPGRYIPVYRSKLALDRDRLLIAYEASRTAVGEAVFFERVQGRWQRAASFAVGDHTVGWAALQGDTALVIKQSEVLTFERQNGVWHASDSYRPPESCVALPARALIVADTAFIALPKCNTVHVLRRVAGQWSLVQKLRGRQDASMFGAGLASDGQRLVIGSPSEISPDRIDYLHIFEQQQGRWSEVDVIAVKRELGNPFGFQLAFAGDHVLAARHGDGLPRSPEENLVVLLSRQRDGAWSRRWLQLPTASDSSLPAVAIDRSTYAVGLPRADLAGGDASGVVRLARHRDEATQLLTPTDRFEASGWGSAVAVDSDLALVGLNPIATEATAAYVFARDGEKWQWQRTLASTADYVLRPPLALDGRRALFASRDASALPACALLFSDVLDSKAVPDKLCLPGQQSERVFGGSLSLAGDVAAIRSINRLTGNEGLVDVFELKGSAWQHAATLAAQADQQLYLFGADVKVHEDRVYASVELPGWVFIFAKTTDGWRQQEVVRPAAPCPSQLLATAIAVSGDWLFIGSAASHPPQLATQGVCVLRRRGERWVSEAWIDADDGLGGGYEFGRSLAADGGRLLVGAPRFGRDGKVYLYQLTGERWRLHSVLSAPTTPDSLFGRSVALDGEAMVVGAPQWGDLLPKEGAAFLYRLGLVVR